MMHQRVRASLEEFLWLSLALNRAVNLSDETRDKLRPRLEQAVTAMRRAKDEERPETRCAGAREALSELLQILDITGGLAHTAPRVVQRTLDMAGDPPPASDLEYERLAQAFAWVESRVETRTPREVRFYRWVRLATLVGLCAAGIALSTSPRNVAYHRPVIASSYCSSMPLPRTIEEKVSGVVDGVAMERRFGLCTDAEVHPWVTIDLERTYAISQVVVYDRSDCCWNASNVPLSVQLSTDNQHFGTVGTMKESFPPSLPWKLTVMGHPARYVRLIVASNQPKDIVISEVEVYGR
jgi:hypothetical protein